MTDQIDIAQRLHAHDADQSLVGLQSPELDAGSNLTAQFRFGHVGIVPSVGGNDAAVCDRGVIDDCEHGREITIVTPANVAHGDECVARGYSRSWMKVRAKKSRIRRAISAPWSSSAKCPVSSRCSSARGRSSRYARAPSAGKITSFLPHTISAGG